MEHYIRQIRTALEAPDFDAAAAHQKMTMIGRSGNRPRLKRGQPRIGAVLCLLYPQQDQLRVVLTKRPDRMKDHSGQISFPGGRQDEGETLTETALRETCEEVGVCTDGITVVGALTSIYIPPTDYEVHPFVGFIAQRPIYQPNPGEVDVVLEPTLTHLLDPATRKTEKRKFPQWPLPITIPYYDVDGYKVWGATAIMLSEFLERWRIVT